MSFINIYDIIKLLGDIMKKKKILLIILILLVGIFSFSTVYAAKASNVGENICNEVETIKVLKTANVIITIFKFLVPLIIIVFGTIKFVSAITSQDDKSFMKELKNLGVRCLVGLLVFFVPTIIDAVLSFTNYYSSTNECYKCVFNADECKETYHTSEPN
jgi:hypothetical protein